MGPAPAPFKLKTAPALTIKRAKKLTALAGIISLGIILFVLGFFYFGHSFIIKNWPEMQTFYVMVGLAEDPLKDALVLEHITSERRYLDGAMQLVVEGKIRSKGEKTQVLPGIFAEALGPDGHIIQSWRIEPPTATLDPNMTIPFKSAVLSPEGTVVEVNLSFAKATHDEH